MLQLEDSGSLHIRVIRGSEKISRKLLFTAVEVFSELRKKFKSWLPADTARRSILAI